jgi:hypothetical protein
VLSLSKHERTPSILLDLRAHFDGSLIGRSTARWQ